MEYSYRLLLQLQIQFLHSKAQEKILKMPTKTPHLTFLLGTHLAPKAHIKRLTYCFYYKDRLYSIIPTPSKMECRITKFDKGILK